MAKSVKRSPKATAKASAKRSPKRSVKRSIVKKTKSCKGKKFSGARSLKMFNSLKKKLSKSGLKGKKLMSATKKAYHSKRRSTTKCHK